MINKKQLKTGKFFEATDFYASQAMSEYWFWEYLDLVGLNPGDRNDKCNEEKEWNGEAESL